MLFNFCLYLLTGAVMGGLSGLLGIGGSIISTPCLAWLFIKQGMPLSLYMHMAEGTSMAAIFVTGLMSVFFHHRRKLAIWPIYRQLLLGILLGTLLGALVAYHLSSEQLHSIFSVFMFGFGLYMLLSKEPKVKRVLPGWLYLLPISMGIGTVSGLLGIGGGLLTIPFLHFYQVPMRQAVAVSVACASTIALFGGALFIMLGLQQTGLPSFSSGYVYWPAFTGLVLVSPLFAYYGVELSHRLPAHVLKRGFALLLLVVGFYMAWGFK